MLRVLQYKAPSLRPFQKEVIKQNGDVKFTALFDHIRVTEPYDDDLEILKSKFIATVYVNYPGDVFHNFEENMPSTAHNVVAMPQQNINDLLKKSNHIPPQDPIKSNKFISLRHGIEHTHVLSCEITKST